MALQGNLTISSTKLVTDTTGDGQLRSELLSAWEKKWLGGGIDRDSCHCDGLDGNGSHSTLHSFSHQLSM
eukprot:15346399-Ditylum_brightwellii.AAC.1